MSACTQQSKVLQSKPPVSTSRDSSSIILKDSLNRSTSPNEEYQQSKIDSIKKNKPKPKKPRTNKND